MLFSILFHPVKDLEKILLYSASQLLYVYVSLYLR